MAEASLEKLERQYQQAKARLEAARAREREKIRKLDARRKIILGGALIERATRDAGTARLLADLIAGLSRQQDRQNFENWPLPAPAPSEAPTSAHSASEALSSPEGPEDTDTRDRGP